MASATRVARVTVAAALAATILDVGHQGRPAVAPRDWAKPPRSREGAPRTPPFGLRFEANVGQADPSVRFVARWGRATVLVTSDALVLVPPGGPAKVSHAAMRALVEGGRPPAAPRGAPTVVRLRGADARAPMIGEAPIAASITTFRGSGGAGLAIPSFERVRARDVYPGIDLVLHPGPRGIEIDFEIAPDADASRIAFASDRGDADFVVRADGSLASRREGRDIVLSPPRTFELTRGGRADVRSAWSADATFALGARTSGAALVIDPVLDMTTYLGGSGDDTTGISGVALDAKGDIYVAGTTTSSDLPFTAGAPDPTLGGADDVFVAKMTADGKSLVYCTYLGGSDLETYAYLERPIVVDKAGAVYVSGQTASTDFPTTPGAYDTTHNGGYDAYVTKLAPDGKSLVYSTLLGGSGDDHGFGLAVDATGAVFLGGWTKSSDFPITPGSIASSATDFVAKIAPNGASLLYSTHAGGPSMVIFALAATNGFATVTGDTRSDSFPITPGAFQQAYGGGLFDVAVMQLDATGTGYRYSTYLGGSDLDESFGIDVDAAGNAIIVGDTYSASFPTTPNAFQKTFGGDKDAWVAKLDAKGQKMLYGSFIGSAGYEGATGVCIDPSGNAFISGLTLGGALPTKSSCATTGLGYVQMLEPSGNVKFSTLMPDQVFGVACAQSRVVGFMSVVGDNLATPGAYDTSINGASDMLLFGLRAGSGPAGALCKPCDGAFGAAAARACDDPARPLCNTSGALSGTCTICNAADATRCPKGTVCGLLTGECVDPPPDAGADGGVDGGLDGFDAAVGAPGGIDAGAGGNDGSDASSEADASSCSCRATGAGGATPTGTALFLAVLTAAAARSSKRLRMFRQWSRGAAAAPTQLFFRSRRDCRRLLHLLGMGIQRFVVLVALGLVACGSEGDQTAVGSVVAEAPSPEQPQIPGPAAPDAPKPDGEVDSAGDAQVLGTTVRPISTIRGLPAITPSEIVGTLVYGVESANVSYTNPPSYRAFKFTGAANDRVVATVTAVASATPYVWIATEAGTTYATGTGVVKATLPTSGGYLVVFREPLLQPGTYRARIDLEASPPLPPPPPPPPPPAALDVPAGYNNVPFPMTMTCHWTTKRWKDIFDATTTSGLYLETITMVLRSAPATQTFQAWKSKNIFSSSPPGLPYPLSHVKLTATTGPDVQQSSGQQLAGFNRFIAYASACKWAQTSGSRCPYSRNFDNYNWGLDAGLYSMTIGTTTASHAHISTDQYPQTGFLSVSITAASIDGRYDAKFKTYDTMPPAANVEHSVTCTGSQPLP